MKVKIFGISILLVMVVLFTVSCKKEDEKKGKDVPSFAVSTEKLHAGNIKEYIALTGDIWSGSNVDVYSEVAGKITRVYVSVGSKVSKGTPIAAVDPSQPGMNYVQNTVRSPIAGTITVLPAEIGMQVSPQLSIAQVAGNGALEVRLKVSERFIYQIQLGLPCEIHLDAYPGESFKGKVSEVSPIVDPSSRTMDIKVNVDNQSAKLKSGMFATVKIIVADKDDAITIPFTSVLQNSETDFVYIAVSDPKDPAFKIAKQVSVKSGIHTDDILEILEGLSENDEVIVKGHTTLTDGARLNIITSEDQQSSPNEHTEGDSEKGGNE
ncbi:MAG: efflux RND transporter periplasmic adaptor subunit [Termitinemataceae bacterium]|nr:MAG: efflux RND transporter periplasmic adaptor subunit [Termitinemataceae bacterium]